MKFIWNYNERKPNLQSEILCKLIDFMRIVNIYGISTFLSIIESTVSYFIYCITNFSDMYKNFLKVFQIQIVNTSNKTKNYSEQINNLW